MDTDPDKQSASSQNDASVPPRQNLDGVTPQQPAETPAVTSDPDGITPPKPGEVIGAEPTESTQPAGPLPTEPQPVVTSNGRGKKGWLKTLLILVVIAALAAGGWWAYQKYYKKAPSNTASQSKDIPLIRFGIQTADYGKLYPDMSTSEYGYLVNSQIFEGLVRYENKSKIVPALASKWTNPDSKTWIFTIRDGIKFHDGHTLTAQDVKYSLDTVIAAKSDIAETFASTIDTVKVSGNKVTITTADPDPTLLNRLAFLYVIDANLPKGDEPSQAGTGPYQVKTGTTPTTSNYQLVAFDGYHGGKPATRALSFGNEADADSLITAFKAHKYDIAGIIAPDQAKSVAGASRFISSEPDVDFIGFNTVSPGPLQKKEVREAIRYAVDPLAIGKARGSTVTPLSQLIPQSIPGYNPAISPYKRDVAKAKQLLAQAGYPQGVTLKLSLASAPAVGTEISNELKQAGITVTIDQHKDFNEFIDYFLGGKAEMFTADYASDTLDGLDIYQTTLLPDYYKNPQFSSLLDQAGTTVDPARRLKLLQDAAVIVDKDAPVVPLSTEDDLWLMDKPYVLHQDMPSSLISVYFYKVHQQ